MSRDLVSVILPVYNAERTLDVAMQSIADQSLGEWELIVIDDGSDDASRKIIDTWSRKESRIRTYYRKHRGLVPALQTGLDAADGPYVARMDADDRSLPRRLELQKRFLDKNRGIGLTACRVRHLGSEKKEGGYARYVRWTNTLLKPEEIAMNRFIESPLAHPSVMFRSELVDKHGGYREGPFPEDYELWLRWLEKGVKMQKIPEELLIWRDTPHRLSRTGNRYSFEAFYRLKARYLARWLQRENAHHPEVVVWGAGRTSRKRSERLCEHGVSITHYVDIDPDKIGNRVHGRPVWSPDDLPEPGSVFVVSYVARHGANQMIRRTLKSKGYRMGRDFIFAA